MRLYDLMSGFHDHGSTFAGCSTERHRLIEHGAKVKEAGELVQEPAATSLARFRTSTVEEPDGYRCACCRAALNMRFDQSGEDRWWNERVVRRTVDGETWFAVHEVYYEGGKPTNCTVDPVYPDGETLDELRQAIRCYARACDLPALDYENFREEVKEPCPTTPSS